jgi:hypothetical protein
VGIVCRGEFELSHAPAPAVAAVLAIETDVGPLFVVRLSFVDCDMTFDVGLKPGFNVAY